MTAWNVSSDTGITSVTLPMLIQHQTTIYVVSRDTLTAWNVSSGKLIAEKKVHVLWSSCNCLVAVKGGVLIITGTCTLQMWNFEFSKCVWCWINIGSVTDVIPVSHERVACATKEGKVNILDTTSGEFLSPIQIGLIRNFLACNSKFKPGARMAHFVCRIAIPRSVKSNCILAIVEGFLQRKRSSSVAQIT